MDWPNLTSALRTKCAFVVKNINDENPNQLRILGSVPQSRLGDWLLIMDNLHQRAVGAPWTVDVSKPYFRLKNKLVYGWRLIFQSVDEIARYGDDIASAIQSAQQSARREVEEFPLMGSVRGGQNSRGKGAGYMGEILTGPSFKGRMG